MIIKKENNKYWENSVKETPKVLEFLNKFNNIQDMITHFNIGTLKNSFWDSIHIKKDNSGTFYMDKKGIEEFNNLKDVSITFVNRSFMSLDITIKFEDSFELYNELFDRFGSVNRKEKVYKKSIDAYNNDIDQNELYNIIFSSKWLNKMKLIEVRVFN